MERQGRPDAQSATPYRDEVYFGARPEQEIAFAREEYRQRLERVRALMAERGIDCLYLTSPESMFYLVGYQAEWYQAESPRQWPPCSGVAVHVDHDRFILFEGEREAILTRIYTISDDTRFFPRDSYRDGIGFIAETLKDEGWLGGNIGLEFWSHRPNRAVSERFQAAFEAAGADVIDGSDILREVRWVKSPAEVACLLEAARIADIGQRRAREVLRAGVSELEVYGEIVRAMAAAGGENPGITMPVLSGDKANCTHALASRRKMAHGEIVTVDVCGVYNRYHINQARTYSIGEPAADTAEACRKAAGSMEVVRQMLRPNLPVRELNEALLAYYQEVGLWDRRGWIGGYEMGIAFPPDWVGNFVFDPLSEINQDRVFAPGTAVNYENQFFLPRHEGLYFMIESFLFTELEGRLLSSVPYDLTVIA
ncbi:M24 family metallopeptidase [Afifella pfennigii]|uniref:M24 family metallopeptidase n=1 Tax=Afifella pfennigii TaxID=209897 RepID=UPI00146FA318|nr:Xaa-Pro peptidase family protein [Afifella pfennigii]